MLRERPGVTIRSPSSFSSIRMRTSIRTVPKLRLNLVYVLGYAGHISPCPRPIMDITPLSPCPLQVYENCSRVSTPKGFYRTDDHGFRLEEACHKKEPCFRTKAENRDKGARPVIDKIGETQVERDSNIPSTDYRKPYTRKTSSWVRRHSASGPGYSSLSSPRTSGT